MDGYGRPTADEVTSERYPGGWLAVYRETGQRVTPLQQLEKDEGRWRLAALRQSLERVAEIARTA